MRPPEVLDGGVSGLGDDDRPGVVVLPDDRAVRLGEGLDHLEVVLREELVVQHALVEGEPGRRDVSTLIFRILSSFLLSI